MHFLDNKKQLRQLVYVLSAVAAISFILLVVALLQPSTFLKLSPSAPGPSGPPSFPDPEPPADTNSCEQDNSACVDNALSHKDDCAGLPEEETMNCWQAIYANLDNCQSTYASCLCAVDYRNCAPDIDEDHVEETPENTEEETPPNCIEVIDIFGNVDIIC